MPPRSRARITRYGDGTGDDKREEKANAFCAAAVAVPNPATPAAEEPEQPLYSTAELLQRAAARRQQLEVELVAIAEQRAKLEKALEVVRLRQQQASLPLQAH